MTTEQLIAESRLMREQARGMVAARSMSINAGIAYTKAERILTLARLADRDAGAIRVTPAMEAGLAADIRSFEEIARLAN